MENRNPKLTFLNDKFAKKYRTREGPARIFELYQLGHKLGKIVLRTGWDYKDIQFIISYMEEN